MSETPVLPAPGSPPDPAEPRRLSVGRNVGLVLLGGSGLLAVLVIATATYAIAREYGADSIPWFVLAAWALLPAALWTAATAVLRAGLGSAVWSPWLVGLFVLVLTTLLAGGLAAAADAAHDADATERAAACSPADVAVLTSMAGYSAALGAPMGDADGSCIIVLGARADAAGAVDSVVSAIVADGWTAAGAAGDGSVMVARSGVYVVVRASGSDGKGWTGVVVGIPAG